MNNLKSYINLHKTHSFTSTQLNSNYFLSEDENHIVEIQMGTHLKIPTPGWTAYVTQTVFLPGGNKMIASGHEKNVW